MRDIWLYDLRQPALILLAPSGIRYHNQTAGTTCWQQEAEGILVPLIDLDPDSECRFERELAEPLVNVDGIEERRLDAFGRRVEVADALDAAIHEMFFGWHLRLDRARLAQSQEAWLYVLAEPVELSPGAAACGFSWPCAAVLTWDNSD